MVMPLPQNIKICITAIDRTTSSTHYEVQLWPYVQFRSMKKQCICMDYKKVTNEVLSGCRVELHSPQMVPKVVYNVFVFGATTELLGLGLNDNYDVELKRVRRHDVKNTYNVQT